METRDSLAQLCRFEWRRKTGPRGADVLRWSRKCRGTGHDRNRVEQWRRNLCDYLAGKLHGPPERRFDRVAQCAGSRLQWRRESGSRAHLSPASPNQPDLSFAIIFLPGNGNGTFGTEINSTITTTEQPGVTSAQPPAGTAVVTDTNLDGALDLVFGSGAVVLGDGKGDFLRARRWWKWLFPFFQRRSSTSTSLPWDPSNLLEVLTRTLSSHLLAVVRRRFPGGDSQLLALCRTGRQRLAQQSL